MASLVCVTILLAFSALISVTVAQNGVSLRFMGNELVNGSSRVCLSEIGEQLSNNSIPEDNMEGPALICRTTNTACCRTKDTGGSAAGFWTFPIGSDVQGLAMNPMGLIYRNRGTRIVRLNARTGSSITGEYCCMLPGDANVTQTLCVDVTLDAAVCNPSTMTTNPGPPTSTNNDAGRTTDPSQTTTSNPLPPAGQSNIGAIAGGIIAAVVVVALILIIAIVVVCFSRRMKTSVAEVENTQKVMMETKNVTVVHYETIDSSLPEEAVYTEVDDKPTRRSKKSTSPASNKTPSETDLADMYAVSNKNPDDLYTVPNKKASSVVKKPSKSSLPSPQPDAEYAEIDKQPNPRVPKKSTQLEEYLESKPVDQFTHFNGGYSEIEVGQRPKSHTLQPLSRPIPSVNHTNNPLYDQAAVVRSHSVSATTQHSISEAVYADPTSPPPKEAKNESENIYETIYSESIQPSSFKTPTPQHSAKSADLCPYSSIYTLPASPLAADQKPLIVTPGNIQKVQDLGTGNFGNVILAKTIGLSLKQLKQSNYDNDTNVRIYVAVKMLKNTASSSVKEAFEKEYKFMSRLNHDCVIRLLGVCTEGTPFIMMEYMEKGDLNQYLKNFDHVTSDLTAGGKRVITTASLVYISTQIASGMEYLAHQNFVHRDLATRNILVGQDNVVKIADFGMSRNLYESHYYIIQGHAILPIRWMASECFYGKFSAKSDVWAFGVTMWEIFTLTKQEPYSELTDAELVEDAVKITGRHLLQRPEACPVNVFRVMEECWVQEPSERATFEDVFALLSSLNFKYSSH